MPVSIASSSSGVWYALKLFKYSLSMLSARIETLALSSVDDVVAANGRKHFSRTSCERSSLFLTDTECGCGALLGRTLNMKTCERVTITAVGMCDEAEGDIRSEKAGNGSDFKLSQ